jgi:hypothetical protein
MIEPGAKAMTSVMGFDGHDCAPAVMDNSATHVSAGTIRLNNRAGNRMFACSPLIARQWTYDHYENTEK